MSQKRKYKKLGTTELTPEIDAQLEQQIEIAEKELQEIRVNFRWGKEQLETVKNAAQTMGVPYQTYIKQVVFRQSIEDLRNFQSVKEERLNTAQSV